jgi:hypothetical protein
VLLTLTAVDVAGPQRWRWLLTDEAGVSLADHQVDLADQRSCEGAAAWTGEAVFGPVISARLRDTAVMLPVTAETAFLPGHALEAVTIGGETLAERRVSLVYDIGPARPKTPIGAALRVLALYSLPARQLPLAVRRERYELTRTLRRLASTARRAIELRVLQYGVTRQRLGDVVQEAPGWDVLHISAHGAVGTLLLEQDDGSPDELSAQELIELLAPTGPALKLIHLSVCDSGASAAAEVLRRAGLPEASDARLAVEAERAAITAAAVPSLAQRLAAELGTVVLAMRAAVPDRFAAELSAQLYPQLFANRQPVARALALALPRAVRNVPDTAWSAALPVLFGAAADRLVLAPPPGSGVIDPYQQRMAWFEDEPRTFVGRTAVLASASAALRPDSGRTGVLFLGPRGTGTTSCALELAYRHRDAVQDLAWWRAAPGNDLRASLTGLAAAWRQQLGLQLDEALGGEGALKAYLPRLRATLRQNSLLLVIDAVDALLTPDGTWRNPWWAWLFAVLAGHGGDTRVVLAGARSPVNLDASLVLVQPLPPLSMLERVQAFSEREALSRLLPASGPSRSTSTTASTVQAGVLRRLLTLTGGRPGLIDIAEEALSQPADPIGDPPDDIPPQLAAMLDGGADRATLVAAVRAALTVPEETS